MRKIAIRLAGLVLVAQICGAGAGPLASAQEPAAKAGFAGSFRAYAPEGVEPRVSDFSGLPVPRYSSLRYDKVYGRSGPSRDYPVEWTYERAGLPVVVVRESRDWRKVRDPQGDEVWIKNTQLSGERTAMTMSAGAIRRRPEERSPIVADFRSGGVVALGECQHGWCRVEAEGLKGWVRRDQLWGADDMDAAPAASASH